MVYATAEMTVVTEALDDALTRRTKAKAEIDKLRSIVAGCDEEIMAALNAEDDEFTKWVLEVRGEIQDYEKRKITWTHNGERYVVYKRKGSAPRKTISPEKLLAQGVPAHVIQAATTYGEPGKEGIGVRKLVGKDEEEEE